MFVFGIDYFAPFSLFALYGKSVKNEIWSASLSTLCISYIIVLRLIYYLGLVTLYALVGEIYSVDFDASDEYSHKGKSILC